MKFLQPYKIKSNFLSLITFGLIFALAAYLRLINLTREGMIGADVFQYWQIAKWWTEGNFTLDGFYRPFIYLLYALWMKIYGEYDYTLSLFNVLSDLVNIGLIYLTTKKLTRKTYPALAASLIYATFPGIIYFARISLVHIPSTTFVLLSFLSYHSFLHQKQVLFKNIFAFSTGLLVSLAAHIHPDLLFLAPVYILFLVIHQWQTIIWRKLLSLTKPSFLTLYLIGLLVPYLLGFFYYGLFMIFNTLLRERADGATGVSVFALWWQIIYSGIKSHTYPVFPYFGSVLIATYNFFSKLKPNFEKYLPILLVLGYATIGSFILTRYIERLFVPLIPLVLISIVVWVDQLFPKFTFLSPLVIVTGVVIFTYLNMSTFMPTLNKYQSGYQTIYRETYDVLKNKVDANNKLLVTPYIFYSHRKGFQAPFYFGSENARYIIEFPYDGRQLSDLVEEYKFKYIYIAKQEWWFDVLERSRREIPIDFYGMRRKDWKNGYQVEKELEILQDYLQSIEAKKFFESEKGIIFQLQ